MANTLSANIIAERVAEKGITVLQHKVLPFEKFCTDFSGESMRVIPGAGARSNINVPISVSGSATLTNPTNYESGDSEVSSTEIQMNEYSQPFHITNDELNNGHRFDRLLTVNMHALMDKLNDIAMANVTTVNYGAAVVNKAPGTINADDLKTVYAAAEKFGTRNLILNGTVFSNFLPTNRESFTPGAGAYGYDSFNLVTKWDAAGNDIVGFCAETTAMACASRLPERTGEVAEVVDMATVQMSNGLIVQVSKWCSVATRNTWNSFDVVFGAGVGDVSALKIIGGGAAAAAKKS